MPIARRRPPRHVHLTGCRVDLVTREVHRVGSEGLRLTQQEARLLARLAATPGEAVSRRTLLVEVWDYHPDSSSRAPDIAVRRLRMKLEEDPSAPVHVATVLGLGWVLRGSRAEVRRERPPGPELVGREELVEAVDRALMDHASVCLVGPPGVGKTALARHVLHGLEAEVISVSLEGVKDEGAFLAAVAAALRLPVGSVPDLGRHLGPVLDDREALLWMDAPEAVVIALVRWLRVWPGRFLVTSRVAVPAMHAIEVPPLSLVEAELLFGRLAPGLTPGPRVLEGLDGLPLAIRLAAARAHQLGVEALIGDHGLRYERVAARDESEGLADSLGRSWDLLDPEARGLMCSLAPLLDSFDLATAEALTPPGERWVGELLVDLVDSSLLIREPGPRYRMLQSVRWFAARAGEPDMDRLIDWAWAGSGSWPTLRHLVDLVAARRPERLTELVLRVDEGMGERLPPTERRALLQRGEGLEVAYRLALVAWKLGEHGADEHLETFLALGAGTPLADRVLVELARARRAVRRPTEEDVAALRTALDRSAQPELRMAILWELAEQHADRREFRQARLALHQAMAVDREGRRRAEWLCELGHIALKQDQPADGLAAVEEAVGFAGDGPIGERAWRTLGGLRYLSGDLDGAAAAWEDARHLARRLGLWRQDVVSLGNLGVVYADLGELPEARRVIEEALARSEELGQAQTTVPNLVNLGQVALLEGDLVEAQALLSRAVDLGRSRGWVHHVIQGRLALAVAAQLAGQDARPMLREVQAEALQAGAHREAELAAAHLELYAPQGSPSGTDEARSSVETRLLAAARARLVALALGSQGPGQARTPA